MHNKPAGAYSNFNEGTISSSKYFLINFDIVFVSFSFAFDNIKEVM